MILNYKTGKLPLNFIFLGAFLLIIGVWRIIILDWVGIIIVIISLLLLFLRTGIMIDTKSRRLKKYVGFYTIKLGEWEDINLLKHLQIIKVKETQGMNVLSISRTASKVVYKLILVFPNKKNEIIKGEKDFIIKVAENISLELRTTIINSSYR